MNTTILPPWEDPNTNPTTYHPIDPTTTTIDTDNLSNYITCYEPDSPIMLYRFVVNGVLLNVIGCLGILGNIISMVILSRPQMRSSINYLLIGLARVDTVLIITSIFLFGLPGIYPYTGLLFSYYYNVYPHIVPIVYPLATVAQTASVYLTVMVSLDRFVAVCHPLRSRSLCTYGRARVYVIGIVVFSVLYNLPRLWEAKIRSEWEPAGNVTVYCAVASELRLNEVYVSVYIHWCYLIFIYLVPFVTLAILNAAIYRQVRVANKERQRMSRLQRREIGLATMLLCVVMVFFACNILPLVINIIESFNIPIEPFLLDRMIRTSNLLVTINSSVNFIIYVIFGEKFKRVFLLLFCGNGIFHPIGRDSPDGATHDDSFMSNGDRTSIRLHRQTTCHRNGVSIRLNGSTLHHNSPASTGGFQLHLITASSPTITSNSNKTTPSQSLGQYSVRTRRAPALASPPRVYYPVGCGSARNGKESAITTTTTTTGFTAQEPTGTDDSGDWGESKVSLRNGASKE